MRTHLIRGAIGGSVVLLLSASLAFAQGRPASFYGGGAQQERTQTRATTTTAGQSGVRQSGGGMRPIFATTSQRELGQSFRADAQARVAELRARVQERLAAIEDRVTQRLATRLSGQFDRLNAVWTNHFSELLDRYAAILQKIQDRVNAAAASGQNIAPVTAAIQSAQTAITTARAAVAAQAAKTYTPDLSATTTPLAATTTPADQGQLIRQFQSAFQGVRAQLFSDLFALRDGPMAAVRTAVVGALQALEKVPGVGRGNAATSTEATSTNQ